MSGQRKPKTESSEGHGLDQDEQAEPEASRRATVQLKEVLLVSR